MINKILRKNKPKESWSSYTERGKDSREWKEMMKAKIKYLREELNKEITEYIRNDDRQNLHNP